MTNHTRSLLALLTLVSLNARADLVGAVGQSDAPAYAPVRGKAAHGLRDLLRCSEGIAGAHFGNVGRTMVPWQASDYNPNGSIKYPAVAVSTYLPNGLGAAGRSGFLTVSENKIIFTPDVRKTSRLNPNDTSTSLTLDLTGAIDPKNELPIVDSRDFVRGSWAQEVFWKQGSSDHGPALRKFDRREFGGAETAIKASDALTGDQGRAAMDQLRDVLKQRIAETPANLKDILDIRQRLSARTISRGAGDHSFSTGELNTIRDGLCACEGLIDNVEATREQILKSDISVWDGRSAHALERADLGCGMS